MSGMQKSGEYASTGFLLLLGAMSAFPPITTDIYLPALPELTHSLRGTITGGQVTLAVYFVGLGLGQLFYGPWSDRVGRRPAMLVGAPRIYLAASVGCAVSHDDVRDDRLAFCAGDRGMLRRGDFHRRGTRSVQSPGVGADLLHAADPSWCGSDRGASGGRRDRHVVGLACDLLGCHLVWNHPGRVCVPGPPGKQDRGRRHPRPR